ncbi:transcription cofactor [Lithospermum erythrorhizon]|uniref:Transcription cofactor n=1 Tax=Lithospermum erythrorhizon TaxID=34254 RepID=A0AAV3PPK9_LITER
MEGEELLRSPQMGCPAENGDAKHVSGLSTMLVATIEEAKDRISQIEDIFCHQLYPSLQSKSKSLQKIYYEARKDAEDEYKVNDKSLLLQMEELREMLKQKTNEVNVGKEVQLNLENIIRSKDLMLIDKDNMLKERSEMIESRDSERMQNEQVLRKYEKENRLLLDKVENLESKIDKMKRVLQEKSKELEDGGKVQEHLLRQIDLYKLESAKRGKKREDLEKQNDSLMVKLKDLQHNVDKLQVNLQERSNESDEGMALHEKLLQQIKARDSELLAEKKKMKEMVISYKKLKSQYNFLFTKVPRTEIADDAASELNQNPITLCGIVPQVTGHTDEQHTLADGKGVAPLQQTKSLTPSNIIAAPGCPANVKSCPPAGSKRSATYWRNTRSHQSRNGPDLHDNFLDTPLDNLRGNKGKASHKEILPERLPEDMAFVNSDDDEPLGMNVKSSLKKEKLAPPRPGVSAFKFVEPVRKKAEREKLKGVECKQCKKFYDSVLPHEGNESSGTKNLRCEHHDGVSRHRYKNEPPSTPDGFWNIGFETEM